MISRTFLEAVGCVLFIGACMALVYLVGGIIENASAVIQ